MISRKKTAFHLQRRKPSRSRRGATAVEFALVVPLVLIVVFALLEVSRASTVVDAAKTAVIAGAREASVLKTSSDKVEQEMALFLNIFGVNSRQITIAPEEIDGGVSEVSVTIEVPLNAENGLPLNLFGGRTVEFTHVIER